MRANQFWYQLASSLRRPRRLIARCAPFTSMKQKPPLLLSSSPLPSFLPARFKSSHPHPAGPDSWPRPRGRKGASDAKLAERQLLMSSRSNEVP